MLLGYGFQQLYWIGHSRLAQASAGHAARHRGEQRLDVVGPAPRPTICSGSLSFAVGSLGALLLFNWPPYLKIAAQRDLPDHRRRRPLGRPGPVPAFAQQRRSCAYFPTSDASARHWSRWSVDPAGWFFGGYMAMQVLQDFDVDRPVAPADRLLPRAGPVRARHGRPVAAPGAVPRPDEERRDRAFNVTLGVSVLFAAFWLLWVFGMMKAFWLLLVVGGPAGGRSASSTGRWTTF